MALSSPPPSGHRGRRAASRSAQPPVELTKPTGRDWTPASSGIPILACTIDRPQVAGERTRAGEVTHDGEYPEAFGGRLDRPRCALSAGAPARALVAGTRTRRRASDARPVVRSLVRRVVGASAAGLP